jgi:predicted  nucleic acid-binding Zn-ribbon protein
MLILDAKWRREKMLDKRMEGLIRLQDCDGRISDLLKRKEEGPRRIHALDRDVDSSEMLLKEAKAMLDARKQDRRQLERDIDDLESRASKSQTKLSGIKSNKEYQAALKEIDDLKTEQARLEDRALEIMEELDALEVKCRDMEAERKSLRQRVEAEKRHVEEEIRALDRELDQSEKDRHGISQTINRELLSRYDLIRTKKMGVAVSPVIKGVCQTCHLAIPPQKYNELIRGADLLTCPHCQRIIYWGDDERFKAIRMKDDPDPVE